jgi:hypothetical protein
MVPSLLIVNTRVRKHQALPSNSAFMVPLGSRYFPSGLLPHPTPRTAQATTETRRALRINNLFMTSPESRVCLHYALRKIAGKTVMPV